MCVTSDRCWLSTTLSKYTHFIRDRALPDVIDAKAQVQDVGERERRKEMAIRRNDKTNGIRRSWREVAVRNEIRIYDRVEEVVVHRVVDV
jgi:hypothetical protein